MKLNIAKMQELCHLQQVLCVVGDTHIQTVSKIKSLYGNNSVGAITERMMKM